MNLNEKIQVEIKTHISESSTKTFYDRIRKINENEFLKLQEAKYIIILMYLQIGNSDSGYSLEYRNKNEIYLNLQPKIKNYVIFKSEESLNNYKENELNGSDLYLTLNVENGKIIIK